MYLKKRRDVILDIINDVDAIRAVKYYQVCIFIIIIFFVVAAAVYHYFVPRTHKRKKKQKITNPPPPPSSPRQSAVIPTPGNPGASFSPFFRVFFYTRSPPSVNPPSRFDRSGSVDEYCNNSSDRTYRSGASLKVRTGVAKGTVAPTANFTVQKMPILVWIEHFVGVSNGGNGMCSEISRKQIDVNNINNIGEM